MNWLEKIQKSEKLRAIGLMSGTSADGLDFAHITINVDPNKATFVLEDFFTFDYSQEIKEKILKIAAPNGGNIEDVCKLNFFLGHLYSDLVLEYLNNKKILPGEIDFIGSHGQTVCHLPEKNSEDGIIYGSTLQISDPSIIANRTGILTVGDFRIADVALGGEGAPLVPIFDYLYFKHPTKNRIILNIGGISNLTYLPIDCKFAELVAFDTGPGNVLIDTISEEQFSIPFDRDGLIAESGEIHSGLLNYLFEDDYFTKTPPKSTGREKYAGPFYQQLKIFVEKNRVAPKDVIATVTELTAKSINLACRKFLKKEGTIDELIISGGGSENPGLMSGLAHYFNKTKILKTDDLGLLSEAKEATCFAMLAYQTLVGKPSNVPSVTGAQKQALLGKICLPFF